MFALALIGALIARLALAAPLGTSYSSYPGSGTYTNDDASIGSRNGLGGSGGSIENSVENGIGTSVFDGSNASPNADWITYRPNQPSHASLQYPARPLQVANNLQDDRPQQAEQQLDVIHNMIANFVSNFNNPVGTPQFKSSFRAAIHSINQKFSEISPQALQHESVQARFKQIKTYFETVVTSIRLRLEYLEEEQRLEAEREAERRRLEQGKSSPGGSIGVNQGTGVSGGLNQGTGVSGGLNQGNGVSGGFNQGTGVNGGYYPVGYPQPQSVPHVDLVAAAIRLQQNFNRLQNDLFQFNAFGMRFNYLNRDSILSEAEASAANLQKQIDILADTSKRYQNADIYHQTQELTNRLKKNFDNIKIEASKYIPRNVPEDDNPAFRF